jgi:hypothetical protein
MNFVVSRQTDYELCVGVCLVKICFRHTDWSLLGDMQGCGQGQGRGAR